MELSKFEEILAEGESASAEFKRCSDLPGRDTFETICSFANRNGGNIFLGVDDDGTVRGVAAGRELEIQRNVINVVHNPTLFNQPAVFDFEQIVYGGKTVLRIWVAPTQGVFRYKGEVFDRIADADVKLKTDAQISALYIRKYNIFTEQRIFAHLGLEDLDASLIARCRKMASSNRPGHPWATMDDMELLQSAQLYSRDLETGVAGFNLACALLLGKPDVVLSACPAYKTDAIMRRAGDERYTDREVVRVNLIESFDKLLAFCEKHLPDPFVLEGEVRVSARNIIVRELVSNILIHREFTNPFPAKIIIDETGIKTENASRAYFAGRLDLNDFNPIPKNPIIANFFSQIGLAEELGSGLRNLEKYSRSVFGSDPVLTEGDIFRARIDYGSQASKTASKTAGQNFSANPKTRESILRAVNESGIITVGEAAVAAGVSNKTAARYLKTLAAEGLIQADGNIRVRHYSRVEIAE